MIGAGHGDGARRSGAVGGAGLPRRGLIAGAAAVAAGLLASRATEPVAAVNPPFLLGQDNVPPTTNVATSITAYAGFGGGTTTLLFANASPSGNDINGVGGSASGQGAGVLGNGGTRSGTGVIGISGATGGVGVTGTFGIASPPAETGNGVYGYATANHVGVKGVTSGPGFGVYGISTGNISSTGVYGYTDIGVGVDAFASGAGIGLQAGSGGGNAVHAASNGGNGVYGFAAAAGTSAIVAGVFGDSSKTYGVIGRTTAAGYSGITGITTTPGAAAFAGTSTTPGAYAAYFQGTTVVQGDFFVVSGGKSAAVPHADGSHRTVYCVESPESWFEDFGKAKFTGGRAEVRLDPDFAAIVHADDYHVFLTEYGDHNMLFVDQQTASGFVVRAKGAPGASGTFSWRVVARRKDIEGKRLAKIDLPKINFPDPAKLPDPRDAVKRS